MPTRWRGPDYRRATTRPSVRRKVTPATPRHGAPIVRLSRATSRSRTDEVPPDRGALEPGQVAGMLDEEGPRHRRRDIGIVHEAEVILERGHAGDEWRSVVTEGLADELERVAQPFAGDAQLVQRLDIGPAQDGLVAANLLVGRPDPRARRIADAMRLGREDRHDRGTIGPNEIAVSSTQRR